MRGIGKNCLWIPAALALAGAISCGSSSSGGGDLPYVRYQVELSGPASSCLMRVKYNDRDGDERTTYPSADSTWKYSFDAQTDAHLYIEAKSHECDNQVTASLYLDSERVKRITRFTATIDGYVRIDAQGNASFEDHSPE